MLRRILLLTALLLLATAARADGAVPEQRLTPVVRTVQAVAPAVVNITTRTVVEGRSPFRSDRLFDQLLEEFFAPRHGRERTVQSLGSGVIIDGRERLVLTNAHVISGASEVLVRLMDGREFGAELLGSDPDFDLAVLRLAGQGELPEARIGRSSDILIGETVVAIGNPYGYTHTVTTGVISALDRSLRTEQGVFTDFIQTDAAINPGNSGGPLMNIMGELIGINTAIQAEAEGIGFAIPVDKARRVVDELLSTGRVAPVWLGLSGQDLDPETAHYFRLQSLDGLLVTEVYPDTPAARAALAPGDVILSMNGNEIADKDGYFELLRNFTTGQRVELQIMRQGNPMAVEVRCAAFENALAEAMAQARWGMVLGGTNRAAGVVESVRPGSPAREMGLVPGDVILQIGAMGIEENDDFVRAFARYRMQNSVLMRVAREGRWYYARLQM
jgi:Do/DeqQ family serine protease